VDDDDDDRLLLLFVFLEDVSDWMAAEAAALYLTSDEVEDDDPDEDDDPPLLMDDILSIAIEEANRFLFFNVKTKLVESESFSSSPPDVVVRSGKSSNINGEDNTVEDAASHR
jgi:hypothetical protein